MTSEKNNVSSGGLFKNAYQFFEQFTAADSCHQVTDKFYVERIVKDPQIRNVVDLGCGSGDSVDYFRQIRPDIQWTGVDISSSPEADLRKRNDADFITFDGIHLPFNDGEVDLVYCHQVLEHVQFPRELLHEVQRVLKPGGYFVGSTSHLEPYHSYSHWNFTPYGFFTLTKDVGLTLYEMRPGIDAFTLFVRKALGKPRFFRWFFVNETPVNAIIGLLGFLSGRRKKEINMFKLMFCGQFIFLIRKM